MSRCAIIGLRNRGLSLLKEVRSCPDLELVAVCDRDEARLQAAVAAAPGVRATTAAEDIFADDSIDAVFLILPNHLHEPMACSALRSGKHVFLEKPMARSVAECERIIAERDAAGCVVMVGYQMRFMAATAQARAILASGVLGRIPAATARWNRRTGGDGLWGRGDWFLDPQTGGGGAFIDLGVHKLDLCLDLLGYPAIERLVAVSRHGLGQRAADALGRNYGIEDALDAWLFAEDLDIRVEASYFRNQQEQEYHDVVLIGERGGLRLNGTSELAAWTIDAAGALAYLPLPETGASGVVQHFADVLGGRCPLRTTPEQSLALQTIVAGCYRSAADAGRPVDLVSEAVLA